MATTKYNPYNAVKKISELKGNYHTQKELGGDYKQYQQDAVQYYNELADNGYSAVADELTMSDYTKSLDILKRFKPDDEFEVDTVYDGLIGKMSSSPLPSGGSSTSSDDILDRLYSPEWEKQYSGIMNTAADIASGKTAPKTSDAVQSILDSFGRTDDMLNGKLKVDKDGNVIGGLNIDHYNEGKSQLDRINNFDYTKESYFDPIMGTYKLKGEDAAKGELAGGAASNSGNIDSYAAANANRQQLAFTNAGHEAARAAAQQNHDNWQKLYDSMGGHLTEMGAINSENLGTAANMHATDSAERQNAMKTAAGLADSEAVRRAEAYLAKLADDTTRYGIDAEVGMNSANNAAALEQLMAEIGAQLQMNVDDNATTRYGVDAEVGMNSANNQAVMERLMAEIAGEKELAGINNTAELQRLGRELAAEKYIAYLNSQTPVEQNQETDDVDESSVEGEAEYDADTIARNVIAGIEDGTLTNIKSYDDFARYLINNGVSISDAIKLRDEWESIHPYLFTDTSAMERNANKVTGGKALAGPPAHTLK